MLLELKSVTLSYAAKLARRSDERSVIRRGRVKFNVHPYIEPRFSHSADNAMNPLIRPTKLLSF